MPPAPRSPLHGTTRLIVDGTNLLYRLGAGRSAPAPGEGGAAGIGGAEGGRPRPAPPAAIIGRLRAAVPAGIAIDLVFDGMGQGVHGRVAQQMLVRYSGRRPADDTILDLASEAIMIAGGGPAAGASVLVVTNDRGLRDRLAAKGVRTVPLQWLLGRLDLPALAAPAPGNRRPPGAPWRGGAGLRGEEHDAASDERRPWKPGRGATAKTGTARRVARHKRHPRAGA